MDETAQSAQMIAGFLQNFITSSSLRLRYRVKARSMKQSNGEPSAEGAAQTAQSAGKDAQSEQTDPRALLVEFSGPDTPQLIARNGELLNALEHIATKMLHLEADEHDRVTFDADHFKANRDRQMQDSAAAAIKRVRSTGQPHAFAPMSSRERRTLHMLLAPSGLPTASSGEGPGRYVVLYPEGADPSSFAKAAPAPNYDSAHDYNSAAGAPRSQQRRPDINQVRNAFRPRY
jgi:spoIIIJ-associated protein